MSADNNGGSPKDSYRRQAERYDYLMNRYLAREASEQEKGELRRLTENGFKERFQERFDEAYHTGGAAEPIPEKVRKEILTNILGHTKPRPTGQWWKWAAAAMIILGGVTWLSVRQYPQTGIPQREYAAETRESEWLVFKGKQFLHLPDGSSVLMNEQSELSYSPALFEAGSREVTLKGEAYFDIAHDPSNAFRVKSGSVMTRVLGTAFNVNMKDKEVIVTVTRGLVEVSGNDGVYAQVKPDQQITVNTETQEFNTALIHAEEEIRWKKMYLVFDNIDLRQAGKLIEERYGVTLAFTHPELTKCHVTASFLNEEDLGTVLKVLSEMTGASYTIDDHQVLITGGSCD